MNKTILIGFDNQYSVNTQKWTYLLLGLLFLVQGILSIKYLDSGTIRSGLKMLYILNMVFMFTGSVLSIIYSITGFSSDSKYAPKIKIDDDHIELKRNIFKPATILNWPDIKRIEFGQYEVNFHLLESEVQFMYKSNRHVSLDIKQAIREAAELKNVEITGG